MTFFQNLLVLVVRFKRAISARIGRRYREPPTADENKDRRRCTKTVPTRLGSEPSDTDFVTLTIGN